MYDLMKDLVRDKDNWYSFGHAVPRQKLLYKVHVHLFHFKCVQLLKTRFV